MDRAALDVAIALGLPHGGWCPRGRWAEDGPIPARYALVETDTPDPGARTRFNVRDSDATLILTWGPPAGGTALTRDVARALGRPLLLREVRRAEVPEVVAWLRATAPARLNVAGPRESEAPGVYAAAHALLWTVLEAWRAGSPSPGRA